MIWPLCKAIITGILSDLNINFEEKSGVFELNQRKENGRNCEYLLNDIDEFVIERKSFHICACVCKSA